MTTMQERVINYLTKYSQCHEEKSSPSKKYRKFVNPEGKIYWVGKKGAVRAGATISSSVSISFLVERNMKLWEAGRFEK